MSIEYPLAFRTQLYVSDTGNVCILQSDYPEDDVIVVLSIHQAEWLYKNLPDVLAEAKINEK